MLNVPDALAFSEVKVGCAATPLAGSASAIVRAQSPAIVSPLAFILSVSFSCGRLLVRRLAVVVVGAGAPWLPAGDELEPARADCLHVAAVGRVERVDGVGGRVERGDAGAVGRPGG